MEINVTIPGTFEAPAGMVWRTVRSGDLEGMTPLSVSDPRPMCLRPVLHGDVVRAVSIYRSKETGVCRCANRERPADMRTGEGAKTCHYFTEVDGKYLCDCSIH